MTQFTSGSSKSSVMPIDKQTKPASNTPVTPALSSRFRNTKTPLTPRLVGSAPASPAIAPRIGFRAQPSSPLEHTNATQLDKNITPRSGPRNSRVGTESPATPATARIRPRTSPGLLAGKSSPNGPTNGFSRFTTNASTSPASRRVSTTSSISKKDAELSIPARAAVGKFLASSSGTQPPIGVRPKSVGFVRPVNAIRANSDRSPTSNTSVGNQESNDKFFRANDMRSPPVNRGARPAMSKQLSTMSLPAMKSKSPEAARQTATSPTRISPKKSGPLGLYRPVSPVKHTVTSPSMVALPDSPTNRRTSIGSGSVVSVQSHVVGHKKSASFSTLSGTNTITVPMIPKMQTPANAWPQPPAPSSQIHSMLKLLASPETLSPRSASLTSSKTVGTSVTSDTDVSDTSKLASIPQDSRIDASSETTQMASRSRPHSQIQSDAANARRERKVLDLEISNSSLLAINKTLERELRKQSTELRRFRRLSRNGRLSFGPSKRSMSGQSVLSTLSEQTDEEDYSDADEESEAEVIDEQGDDSILSNTSAADSIAARTRQRARDERRLMADLSKHQQLLIDSQKLTQSIRKCLGVSEELIKDGKKALEYRVGIGDVKLGGRVLDDHDQDQDLGLDSSQNGHPEFSARRGLLSPSLTLTEMQEAAMWLGGTQGLQDGQVAQAIDQPLLADSEYVNKPDTIENYAGNLSGQ